MTSTIFSFSNVHAFLKSSFSFRGIYNWYAACPRLFISFHLVFNICIIISIIFIISSTNFVFCYMVLNIWYIFTLHDLWKTYPFRNLHIPYKLWLIKFCIICWSMYMLDKSSSCMSWFWSISRAGISQLPEITARLRVRKQHFTRHFVNNWIVIIINLRQPCNYESS